MNYNSQSSSDNKVGGKGVLLMQYTIILYFYIKSNKKTFEGFEKERKEKKVSSNLYRKIYRSFIF